MATRAELIAKRNELLADLKGRLQPVEVAALASIEVLNEAIEKQLGPYEGAQPIDAVVARLRELGRAVKVEDMEEFMLAERVALGHSNRKRNAHNSILYFARRGNKASDSPILRVVDGKVGLYEWADDKFLP
jgi:hypothetical protein